MRIDPVSANAVALILAKSRNRGADPIRALDELGFLLYPEKAAMIASKALTEIAEIVEQVSASQMLGTRRPTVADMKEAIIAFILAKAE